MKQNITCFILFSAVKLLSLHALDILRNLSLALY